MLTNLQSLMRRLGLVFAKPVQSPRVLPPRLRDNNVSQYGQDTPGAFAQIEVIRQSLLGDNRKLRSWEALELDNAYDFLDAGFPALAVFAASRAQSISNLPQEEYTLGFDLCRKHIDAAKALLVERALSKAQADKVASDLVGAERKTADRLFEKQANKARHLLGIQEDAARDALSQNSIKAQHLLDTEERALAVLRHSEERLLEHARDIEGTLMWMANGYSVDTNSPDGVFTASQRAVLESQKKTAASLKRHQQDIAEEVRKHQEDLAMHLTIKEQEEAKAVFSEAAVRARQLRRDRQTLPAQDLKENS